MDPHIHIITLGVADMERSYRFYHEGLGFPTSQGPDDGIVFFQTGGVCLALYSFEGLAEDVSPDLPKEKGRFPGFTLAHNTRSREAVDEILTLVEKAGGTIEKPAQDVFWGGYSGYFSDPDGYLWEVAYSADWEFDENGDLMID